MLWVIWRYGLLALLVFAPERPKLLGDSFGLPAWWGSAMGPRVWLKRWL